MQRLLLVNIAPLKRGHRSNPTRLLHRTLDLVLVAGDGHEVGPIGGLDDHAGDVRARDVEGGGAVVVGALDAGARVGLVALGVAVHALLQGRTKKTTRGSERVRGSGSGGGMQGFKLNFICIGLNHQYGLTGLNRLDIYDRGSAVSSPKPHLTLTPQQPRRDRWTTYCTTVTQNYV